MRLAASSESRKRRSADFSSRTYLSSSKYFDETCDSNNQIRALFENSVDSDVQMCTSRMDVLLITSTLRTCSNSESAAHEEKNSVTTENAS